MTKLERHAVRMERRAKAANKARDELQRQLDDMVRQRNRAVHALIPFGRAVPLIDDGDNRPHCAAVHMTLGPPLRNAPCLGDFRTAKTITDHYIIGRPL